MCRVSQKNFKALYHSIKSFRKLCISAVKMQRDPQITSRPHPVRCETLRRNGSFQSI